MSVKDQVGSFCWWSLMTKDEARANGQQVGGILKRPPGVPEMPPVWMNYFSVPSVEDWSEKAKALGGKVVMVRTEIPETGFFALFEDPTGAMAYLFEWAGT